MFEQKLAKVTKGFLGFKLQATGPVASSALIGDDTDDNLARSTEAMNTFYEHHKNSIKFGYHCFDRILLNGLIQPFQQPERVIGFFNAYREGQRVTRNFLRDIAQQFQNWLKNRCQKWSAPILDAPIISLWIRWLKRRCVMS